MPDRKGRRGEEWADKEIEGKREKGEMLINDETAEPKMHSKQKPQRLHA